MAAPGSTTLASNRDRTTPQKGPPSTSRRIEIGIDKLALSLPIKGIVQDRQGWDQVYSRWARVHEYLTFNTSLDIAARQVGLA
jgi:hypothetical protein